MSNNNMGHENRGGGGHDMMFHHNNNNNQQQQMHQQQYGHQAQQQQQQQMQYGQYQQQQQQQHQQMMNQGMSGMPGMIPSQSWGGMAPPLGGMPMALNGALPPLSLVNPQPGHNQACQVQMSPPQQPQQSPRGQPEFAILNSQPSPPSTSKQSQLLAGTQSMLNGISAITSVVPAITPIGKVKRFQFGSPNGATPQSMMA